MSPAEKAYEKVKKIRLYWEKQPESPDQFLKLWKAKELQSDLCERINGFRLFNL